MRVRCPHCSTTVDVLDTAPLGEIGCPSCGSSFSLVVDETMSYRSSMPKQVAQFQLLEPLGTGTFGTVWKAQDVELERVVAIKIPRKGQLTPDETEKFIREARAVAQLKHPRIVSVHEVGRHDDTVYIVSDLVDGISLSDWLTAKRPTHREAAELCRKLAEALDHAHQCGIIHRDLKPANIMIDTAGEPHIMDFGLAKREAAEVTMTIEGQVLGTPAYMSPEQARGEGHYADRRSDIYSVGVILYELLTGERPFRGNARMLLHQVLHDEPPAPRKLDARIPRDMETICLKCLNKTPDQRYQQAADLAADLGRWLHHEPISARPVGPIGRVWRWSRRNPALATMTSIAVIALIATAGISVAFGIQQWQAAMRLSKQQKTTQNALRQAVAAKGEAEKKRNEARTQAKIAKEKEDFAKKAQDKAEAAERLANERLASIRRYLYAADMNLVQQALADPAPGSQYRAMALLARHSEPQPDEQDLRGFEWSHLQLLCNGEKYNLYRDQAISKVAHSPDGSLMAIAQAEVAQWNAATNEYQPLPGQIRIIECSTGNEIAVLKTHPGAVSQLVFAPDGKSLIEVRESERKILGRAMQASAVLEAPIGTEATVTVDRNNAAEKDSAATEGAAEAEGAEGGSKQEQPQSELDPLSAFRQAQQAISDLGSSAFKSRYQIHIWSSDNWVDCTSRDPIEAAQCSVSADGQQVAVLHFGVAQQELLIMTPDGTQRRIWQQDVTQSTVNRHLIVPLKIELSGTGKQVAIVGSVNSVTKRVFSDMFAGTNTREDDVEVHLVDVESGKVLRPIVRGEIPQFVCYSPDDDLLAIGDPDGEVSLWNPATAEFTRSLELGQQPRAAAYSPNGRLLAVGYDSGSVRVYSLTKNTPVREFRGATQHSVTTVAFSADGNHVVSGGMWGVYVWDAHKDVGITKWKLPSGWQGGIVFAGDDRSLLAIRKPWEMASLFSFRSNAIQIESYNLVEDRPKRAIGTVSGELPYRTRQLFHDGSSLVLPLRDRLDVIKSLDGELRYSIPDVALPSVLSPDRKILTTMSGKRVTVWKMDSGEQLFALDGHESLLMCATYSADSRWLLTGDNKGDVWRWDLSTGQGKIILIGQAACQALVYTPDEHAVLYASGDALFRWRPSTNEVDRLTSAPVPVQQLQLSPDGRTLAMMTDQSVWLLDPYQGQARMHLQHPTLIPGGMAFSNDSSSFAIAWRSNIYGQIADPPEVWIYRGPSRANMNVQSAPSPAIDAANVGSSSETAPP